MLVDIGYLNQIYYLISLSMYFEHLHKKKHKHLELDMADKV